MMTSLAFEIVGRGILDSSYPDGSTQEGAVMAIISAAMAAMDVKEGVDVMGGLVEGN